MDVGCFILLAVIEICVMHISGTIHEIRKVLEDIRDSKENTNNG